MTHDSYNQELESFKLAQKKCRDKVLLLANENQALRNALYKVIEEYGVIAPADKTWELVERYRHLTTNGEDAPL